MNDFRRARQPEQKEERRLSLLHTAGDYLRAGGDVRELSLNELARLASMAKSNVYRYFESREAVLLALLQVEWSDWTLAFTARAAQAPTPMQLTDLVRLVAETVAEHPVLGQLTAILPSVLEHNLSVEAIVSFKQSSLEFFLQIAEFLHQKCPVLSVNAYVGWLYDLVTIIAGLYPFAHPSPAVQQAHALLDSDTLGHDYRADLYRMALAMAEAHRA